MRIGIRADGGQNIGFGHLARTSSLAEELIGRGHAVVYLTVTPTHVQDFVSGAVEVAKLPDAENLEFCVEIASLQDLDAVVTDSYRVDTKYQRAIRDRFPLAVLQDDNRHAVCADLFVNGNLYASKLDYEFLGNEPNVCLGTDYVLMRREIRNRAKDEPPWREQPEYAIVTMGGCDIANLTPTVLRSFDGMDINVDAIVGPGFSEAQEHFVRAVADEISPDMDVVRDPNDLVERMFQADFAVSTSSSTVYELLALGTPIVSCAVAENQEPIAAELRDRDLAAVVDHSDGVDAFADAADDYMAAPELRRRRRTQGRNLIDGCGTERVAGELRVLVDD